MADQYRWLLKSTAKIIKSINFRQYLFQTYKRNAKVTMLPRELLCLWIDLLQ